MNSEFYIVYSKQNIGSPCGQYSNWIITDILSVHYSKEDAEESITYQVSYEGLRKGELGYKTVGCPDV